MRGSFRIAGPWIVFISCLVHVVADANPRSVEREARAFRPIQPLKKTLTLAVPQGEPAEESARWFAEDEPVAEPTFAGSQRDVDRIPPPPVPEGEESVAVPEQSPSPAGPVISGTAEPLPASPPAEEPVRHGSHTEADGERLIPPPEFPENAPQPTAAPVETGEIETMTAVGNDGFIAPPPAEEGDAFPEPRYTEPESDDDLAPAAADTPPDPADRDSPPETKTKPEEGSASPGNQPEPDGPTLSRLRQIAHELAGKGLTYKWGADHPDEGGMDCSGVVQYVLKKMGVDDVPRTSYDQYYWLKRKKLLDDVHGRRAEQKMFKKLAPGDLIFWGGTWKSGHKVSHVMIYLGWNEAEDKHYIFGAQGRKSKGMLGNGVDIFELDPDRGKLIAHGKIPGLVY